MATRMTTTHGVVHATRAEPAKLGGLRYATGLGLVFGGVALTSIWIGLLVWLMGRLIDLW